MSRLVELASTAGERHPTQAVNVDEIAAIRPYRHDLRLTEIVLRAVDKSVFTPDSIDDVLDRIRQVVTS